MFYDSVFFNFIYMFLLSVRLANPSLDGLNCKDTNFFRYGGIYFVRGRVGGLGISFPIIFFFGGEKCYRVVCWVWR